MAKSKKKSTKAANIALRKRARRELLGEQQDKLALDVGGRIAEARRKAGLLTVVALHQRTVEVDSEKKGISRPVLNGYERAHYRPGARELKLLSLALHVTPNWLLFGSETPLAPRAERAQTTMAELIDMTPDQLRPVMISLFMLKLPPEERNAWINLLEVTLRVRWGDKKFAMYQLMMRSIFDLLLQHTGIAASMQQLVESNITPKNLEPIAEELKKRFKEAGVPLPDDDPNPAL